MQGKGFKIKRRKRIPRLNLSLGSKQKNPNRQIFSRILKTLTEKDGLKDINTMWRLQTLNFEKKKKIQARKMKEKQSKDDEINNSRVIPEIYNKMWKLDEKKRETPLNEKTVLKCFFRKDKIKLENKKKKIAKMRQLKNSANVTQYILENAKKKLKSRSKSKTNSPKELAHLFNFYSNVTRNLENNHKELSNSFDISNQRKFRRKLKSNIFSKTFQKTKFYDLYRSKIQNKRTSILSSKNKVKQNKKKEFQRNSLIKKNKINEIRRNENYNQLQDLLDKNLEKMKIHFIKNIPECFVLYGGFKEKEKSKFKKVYRNYDHQKFLAKVYDLNMLESNDYFFRLRVIYKYFNK